ncbi:hypothetical protein [Noviherbaspirillum pedocola]|uniref:Uncharacterized protein n=1 Tax=Noviherbaspirillum pedocola TaxID=2801341 RepID=A0A934SYP0_9BURK|nr:hypothetical protein [Noviherbaspirillum pedocola]MBK4738033.1 hypothetical protein [Noviherbaspirillum pedocola]
MEKLNDGSACFVECDANDASIFYLRKRTLKDWWHESRAQFWAEFGFVEELNKLKAARVAAMHVIASALGVSLDDGSKQQIREAAHGASFYLLDVSRVIAPETLDLSGKSFLISGFETFDEGHKLRRKHGLDRLMKDGRQPLRVDRVADAQGNEHLYVRPRSMEEAFQEFWMSESERRTIEDEARKAIKSAFKPYLDELKGTSAASGRGQGVRPNKASARQQATDAYNVRASVEGLKRAVSADRRKVSRVNLREVIDKDNVAEFLVSLEALLHSSSEPLRLKDEEDEHGNQALYLQERSPDERIKEMTFGLILQRQLSDMKRDTACMIENKLSEVIGLLQKGIAPSSNPLGIHLKGVEGLLSRLRARGWESEKVGEASSLLPNSIRKSGASSGSRLDVHASHGVRHARLVGCSVVAAHPLSFAANNIIVPLDEIRTMLTYGDAVLEEGQAVALKAAKEHAEQMSELEEKSRVSEVDQNTLQGNSARTQAKVKPKTEAKAQGQPGGVPFPQDVRSIRHTPNLLLVPSLGALPDKETCESYWHAYYSALLNTSLKNSSLPCDPPPGTLKGTVVIAPQPEQGPNRYSEANLRGLVRACRERSSVEYAKQHDTELLAITIAHPDEDVTERISRLLDSNCISHKIRESTAASDPAAGKQEQAMVVRTEKKIERFEFESEDDTFCYELAQHLACPTILASPVKILTLPGTEKHKDDDEIGPGYRLDSF